MLSYFNLWERGDDKPETSKRLKNKKNSLTQD